MTEPESKRFHFEQGEELLEELNNGEGVSPELSRTMSEELNQLRRHPDDVLIMATEGYSASPFRKSLVFPKEDTALAHLSRPQVTNVPSR